MTEAPGAASQALLQVVALAATGNGAPAVVVGEPGAGKTRLADELCRSVAGQGVTVLWASCDVATDGPGFWPWLQFLRQYMRQHTGDDYSPALQERMGEIIDMAPGVDDVLNGRAVPVTLDVETARFRLFDAVAQVLRQAGDDGPLLLVLDDLQSADESSLALLRHVGSELWGSRVVLLALTRPVTARSAPALRDAVDALSRARGSRRIDLDSPPRPAARRSATDLSPREEEVAVLVADGLSNRDIAERIYISERTAENHVQNILNKLGFTTRTQVATWVARRGS